MIKVTLERNRDPYPNVVQELDADDYEVQTHGHNGVLLHVSKSDETIATFYNWESVEIVKDKAVEVPLTQYQPTDLTYEKPRVDQAA